MKISSLFLLMFCSHSLLANDSLGINLSLAPEFKGSDLGAKSSELFGQGFSLEIGKDSGLIGKINYSVGKGNGVEQVVAGDLARANYSYQSLFVGTGAKILFPNDSGLSAWSLRGLGGYSLLALDSDKLASFKGRSGELDSLYHGWGVELGLGREWRSESSTVESYGLELSYRFNSYLRSRTEFDVSGAGDEVFRQKLGNSRRDQTVALMFSMRLGSKLGDKIKSAFKI
jgi:hypothetical protein